MTNFCKCPVHGISLVRILVPFPLFPITIWPAREIELLWSAWLNCVGIDLISDVSCKSPYEWVDKTNPEWDFNANSRDGKSYRVSITSLLLLLSMLNTNFLLSFYTFFLEFKGYCIRFWDQAKHPKTPILLRMSNHCCSIDMASF